MSGNSLSPAEAARFLGISEDEARELAGSDGQVPLEAVHSRAGAAALALELARAREEAGRLEAQVSEVRSSNARLQSELREATGERRRLTEEVLDLRAAAEERLMLMERIERISHIEQDLEASQAEVQRLKSRGLLARLLDR